MSIALRRIASRADRSAIARAECADAATVFLMARDLGILAEYPNARAAVHKTHSVWLTSRKLLQQYQREDSTRISEIA